MSVRVGSRRRRRGYGRNRQGAAGPTGIRPQAPLRPAGAAELERGLDILLTGLTTTVTPSGQTPPARASTAPAS
jgi:hypothetical protein